jgi:prepilin-type N-terminal cleavage/methylation domain-containing protein
MKYLRNQSGFTLIEIMAAMGLMAVVLMGVLSLGLQGSKVSKSQNLDLDFSILESNIEAILDNDCKNALAEQTPPLQYSAGTPTPINQIVLPVPTPNPSPNYTAAAVGAPQFGMQVTAMSLNKELLLVNTAGGITEHLVNFNLTAQKTSSNGLILPGTPAYSKDTPIMILVNAGGQIVDCEPQPSPSPSLSPNPSTSGSVTPSACGSANGVAVATMPASNLCSDSSTPAVTNSGTNWTWSCGTSSCSAPIPGPQGLPVSCQCPNFAPNNTCANDSTLDGASCYYGAIPGSYYVCKVCNTGMSCNGVGALAACTTP